MSVFFIQSCPHCSRQRQVSIKCLGQMIGCNYCGRESRAEDPHGESLALNDTMKEHAILADLPPADPQFPHPSTRRPR